MPRTIDGAVAWARANANNMNWAGWCEKFINNAGAFNQAFSSAKLAGDNSGPLRGDWQNAPRGAIHYWYGAGGFGHDAFELGGGLLLMASSSVDDDWGNNLGTVTFQRYNRLGLPYRGWTMRHGTETLAGSSTAGGDRESIDNTPVPPKDEDLMIRIQSTNRGIALVGAGYFYGIQNEEELFNTGPLISAHYSGNDRQFDLWVAMAVQGRGANSDLDAKIRSDIESLNTKVDAIETVGLTDAQVASLVEALRAGVKFPSEFVAEDRNA